MMYSVLEIDSEKVETYRYSIKGRDESIFDKRKVENNAIDYQILIDGSKPGCILCTLFSEGMTVLN